MDRQTTDREWSKYEPSGSGELNREENVSYDNNRITRGYNHYFDLPQSSIPMLKTFVQADPVEKKKKKTYAIIFSAMQWQKAGYGARSEMQTFVQKV